MAGGTTNTTASPSPVRTAWWAAVALLCVVLGGPCGCGCSEAKRVLVLPMPFTSHTKYHTNVARELVKLGHRVWVAMPDYLLDRGVLDTSGFSSLRYPCASNVEEVTMRRFFRDRYFQGLPEDMAGFVRTMATFCQDLLANRTFFQEVRKLKPDFVVIDNVLLKSLTVLPYRLGIPFAFVGPAYDPMGMRVPFSPAVTPLQLQAWTDHMKFRERALTTLFYLIGHFLTFGGGANVVATFAPEMPYLSLDMLVARAEIWLVEIDHILDYPRPTLPNVKLIGGTATGPAKPLPPEFQSFMDSATQGVVVVSFGSYVLTLPRDISDKLFRVFQQLPTKVIFRSNLTSPDPSKIMTSRWLPQNDLLAHPHTKAFVSHCGNNGQYEALYHAVPVVATPLFSDQRYNAERMRVKGFSETIDLNTVTADDMRETILKVATDPRYKQAISKASELFRIEFGVPMAVAGFWLDHVMTYGGEHMRSAGQKMPFYQFVGLDIALLFVTVLVVLLSGSVCCCRLAVRCLCCRKVKDKTE